MHFPCPFCPSRCSREADSHDLQSRREKSRMRARIPSFIVSFSYSVIEKEKKKEGMGGNLLQNQPNVPIYCKCLGIVLDKIESSFYLYSLNVHWIYKILPSPIKCWDQRRLTGFSILPSKTGLYLKLLFLGFVTKSFHSFERPKLKIPMIIQIYIVKALFR